MSDPLLPLGWDNDSASASREEDLIKTKGFDKLSIGSASNAFPDKDDDDNFIKLTKPFNKSSSTTEATEASSSKKIPPQIEFFRPYVLSDYHVVLASSASSSFNDWKKRLNTNLHEPKLNFDFSNCHSDENMVMFILMSSITFDCD